MQVARWCGLLCLCALAPLCMAGCGGAWRWGNDAPEITRFTVNGEAVDAAGQVTGPGGAAATAISLLPGHDILCACEARDPNGDVLTYHWTISASGTSEGQTTTAQASEEPAPEAQPTFVWKTPSTESTYFVSCAVTDGRGGLATRTARTRVAREAGSP